MSSSHPRLNRLYSPFRLRFTLWFHFASALFIQHLFFLPFRWLHRKSSVSTMDFDLVLEEIGEFGRYQQTNYLLLCLPVLFGAANSLSYVFTAGIPNYRLVISASFSGWIPVDKPSFFRQLLHSGMWRSSWSKVWWGVGSQCRSGNYQFWWTFRAGTMPEVYTVKGLQLFQCRVFGRGCVQHLESTEMRALGVRQTWAYHRAGCESTPNNFWTISKTIRLFQWSITCKENQWMLALIGTMHFAGIVVGSGAAGVFADRWAIVLETNRESSVRILTFSWEIFQFPLQLWSQEHFHNLNSVYGHHWNWSSHFHQLCNVRHFCIFECSRNGWGVSIGIHYW